MIKLLRLFKQRYFHCRKGNHVYDGVENGTICICCDWKDVKQRKGV